jgi:hypothetical protein
MNCIYCNKKTTLECSICRESVCFNCADERDNFDGESLVCEGCTDEFVAQVYRDAIQEAR